MNYCSRFGPNAICWATKATMPHELDVEITGIATLKHCETVVDLQAVWHLQVPACIMSHILYYTVFSAWNIASRDCLHISNVFFFLIFTVINTYLCILYTHFLLQAHLSCHGAKVQIASLLLGHIERQTIIRKSLTATFNSPYVIFFGMLGKGGIPEQNQCRHRKNIETPNRNAPGLGIEPATFCEATVL